MERAILSLYSAKGFTQAGPHATLIGEDDTRRLFAELHADPDRPEGIAWWEGLTGLCARFGLRIRYLDQSAIEGLTRWVLNPDLEYR